MQIDQMVRFIKQEAQEKANEIGVSAEEVRTVLHLLLSGEQIRKQTRHRCLTCVSARNPAAERQARQLTWHRIVLGWMT